MSSSIQKTCSVASGETQSKTKSNAWQSISSDLISSVAQSWTVGWGLHLLELQDTSRLPCPLVSGATEWAWNNFMFICLKLSEVHIWLYHEWYVYIFYIYVQVVCRYIWVLFVIYPWQTNAQQNQQSNAAWTPRSFFEKVLLLVQMSATPVANGNDMKWSKSDQTWPWPNMSQTECCASSLFGEASDDASACAGTEWLVIPGARVPLWWVNQWLVNLYKSLYKLCQSKS